jgi:hypothetical protein
MKVYDVDSDEYLRGGEFDSIIDFLVERRKTRADVLSAKYPGYQIRPRVYVANPKKIAEVNKVTDRELAEAGMRQDFGNPPVTDNPYDRESFKHLQEWNIPFYDGIVMETMLHKDNNGYIDVVEFTYQLNCFCKTIFHRMKWSIYNGHKSDGFMFFIWNDWVEKQRDGEFDKLKAQSDMEFDNANNLLDYHQNFVYNDDYKFATVEQVRQLFDQLVEHKVWLGKDGDLYHVYTGAEFDEAETDSKDKFYSGKISKLDEIHIRGTFNRLKPILQTLNARLLFVPSDYPDGTFEGFWMFHKFAKQVWFVPQFLVFYNPNVL